jgi:hypothetical protein
MKRGPNPPPSSSHGAGDRSTKRPLSPGCGEADVGEGEARHPVPYPNEEGKEEASPSVIERGDASQKASVRSKPSSGVVVWQKKGGVRRGRAQVERASCQLGCGPDFIGKQGRIRWL